MLGKLWQKLSLPTGLQLFIMRLFQSQFLVGITGVITNDKNEVLLFKHTYRSGPVWSLPGGYMKAREHPLEGLEREIEEESGFIVSADEEVRIRTDRNSSRLDITVTGKFMGGEFKPSAEVSEYGFFTLKNLPNISKSQLLLIEQVLNSKTL
ncbi:MAG: NUDIX domain-containing protein [Candidatus Levybacteria bacterium]|nr:NUDIX domain-containing protein [Candidatus Levybacteria bacterium]MBP9815400.1 NUDIX domain-containing protein [Candidatus Levybacteria bacterium]